MRGFEEEFQSSEHASAMKTKKPRDGSSNPSLFLKKG